MRRESEWQQLSNGGNGIVGDKHTFQKDLVHSHSKSVLLVNRDLKDFCERMPVHTTENVH